MIDRLLLFIIIVEPRSHLLKAQLTILNKCAESFTYDSTVRYNCVPHSDYLTNARVVCPYSHELIMSEPKTYRVCKLFEEGYENCVFPFKFEGQTYSDCILDTNNRAFCSTTDDWTSVEESTKYCQGQCVFPFIYNGVKYTQCTADGFQNGIGKEGEKWCSLTEVYDKYWRLCTSNERGGCKFPFTTKNKLDEGKTKLTYFCTEDTETNPLGKCYTAETPTDQNQMDCPYFVETWLHWGDYGPCTVTCGKGVKMRFRDCDHGRNWIHAIRGCNGSHVDKIPCEIGCTWPSQYIIGLSVAISTCLTALSFLLKDLYQWWRNMRPGY